MPKVKVGELEMYYEISGREDGPALVFIMGLGGDANWWDPGSLKALGRHYRLLIFDNRDAGRTTWLSEPRNYTIRDMAEDTVALMSEVGFARAHVCGMSMGGMIAQELCLGHPGRVDRLILACTSPGSSLGIPPAPAVMSELLASREGVSLTELAQRLLRVLFTPEWVAENAHRLPLLLARVGAHPISPEGYVRQLMAISQFDAGGRLESIDRPTLVLHGDRDILLPPENGRVLAREIPGARLVIFEGCAHGFTTEQPNRFVSVVREFLDA